MDIARFEMVVAELRERLFDTVQRLTKRSGFTAVYKQGECLMLLAWGTSADNLAMVMKNENLTGVWKLDSANAGKPLADTDRR